MHTQISSISLILGLAIFVMAGLTFISYKLWRALTAARRLCVLARDGEASVTRSLRQFAHELQGLVLSLRGQADKLVSESHDSAPAVAAAAAQLSALADELGHHLTPSGLHRALECEPVWLPELVDEAVATLSATLSPGRRHWRALGPDVTLWADRRALRQVMARLLGEAVRSSRQDDWVEITWSTGPDGLSLTVEDEGAGTMATPSAATFHDRAEQDTRGIGLRLSLAKLLIHAHDGVMEVEALPRIGTRVTVTVPSSRLMRSDSMAPPQPAVMPTAVATPVRSA